MPAAQRTIVLTAKHWGYFGNFELHCGAEAAAWHMYWSQQKHPSQNWWKFLGRVFKTIVSCKLILKSSQINTLKPGSATTRSWLLQVQGCHWRPLLDHFSYHGYQVPPCHRPVRIRPGPCTSSAPGALHAAVRRIPSAPWQKLMIHHSFGGTPFSDNPRLRLKFYGNISFHPLHAGWWSFSLLNWQCGSETVYHMIHAPALVLHDGSWHVARYGDVCGKIRGLWLYLYRCYFYILLSLLLSLNY